MTFSKSKFIVDLLTSPRRRFSPIMAVAGAEALGLDFRQAYGNGALQVEALQAVARAYPVDLLVSFMDLSVEAEAFGCPVAFSAHEVPSVTGTLPETGVALADIAVPAVGTGRTAEVLRCASLCAERFDVPVLSGMIGPFSLAGRLVGMTDIMVLLFEAPDTVQALLAKTTRFLREYLSALMATGVAGVVIAEPAAGLLSPELCREFAIPALREMISAAQSDSFLVVLHNCGRTEHQAADLAGTGADTIHVGNAVDILDILPQVKPDFPVMGNLDPVGVLRNLAPEAIRQRTADLLTRTAGYPNFILSTGCDLPPGVPPEHIQAVVEALDAFNHSSVQQSKQGETIP